MKTRFNNMKMRVSPAIQGRASGFTLLEVVLAISLVLMISAATIGFYRHLGSVRNHTVSQLEMLRHERLIMETICRDLRCAFAMEPTYQAGLLMDSESIQFVTTSALIPLDWAADGDSDTPGSSAFDLRLINYRLATGIDEDGNVVNAGLVREQYRSISAGSATAGSSVRAPEIKFLNFRYFKVGSSRSLSEGAGDSMDIWQDTWSGPTLPDAVEVTLGFRENEDDDDLDTYMARNKYFRRVIHLPAASIASLGQ